MPGFFRSELEIHNSPQRARLPILVDNGGAIADADVGIDQSGQNPKALALADIGSAESKVFLSHRDTISTRRAARIAVHTKGRILLFNTSELIAVIAQGNYVLLQRQTCSHLFRRSISKVEETLGPYGFVRIHRSVLINSAHVEEVRCLLTGEHRVRVLSGKTYNVGRRYTTNLRLLAEAWIDTES
jgi:DNA-binding LytR/AlgR family response regulator